MLVGFHGYMEAAETQVDRLGQIDPRGMWTLVAIQGLNRFYERRTNNVIAGWMTRQDREHAIADNIEYVAAVVDEVISSHAASRPIVFAGFSQGVAMAFRAAAASRDRPAVIAVGGDIPPELDADRLGRLGRVLLCRGRRDEWYTAETFLQDQRRLRDAGVVLTPLEFEGAHEWSGAVVDSAARFLDDCARQPVTRSAERTPTAST
jgi:predicted esterase